MIYLKRLIFYDSMKIMSLQDFRIFAYINIILGKNWEIQFCGLNSGVFIPEVYPRTLSKYFLNFPLFKRVPTLVLLFSLFKIWLDWWKSDWLFKWWLWLLLFYFWLLLLSDWDGDVSLEPLYRRDFARRTLIFIKSLNFRWF